MGVLEKNMQMLELTGFWVDNDLPRGAIYYIRKAFVHNIGLNSVYGILCGLPMYIYKHSDDFSEVSECLGNLVGAFLPTTIYFTLTLQNDELTELVQLLRNVDEKYQPTNEHTKAIYEKTRKLCWFWSVTFPRPSFVVFALGSIVAGMKVVIERDIEHRLKLAFPFDITRPGVFEICAFSFACNFFYATFMVIGGNLMILCMFLNLIGQLRMLNYKMANLRSSAEADVRDQREGTDVEIITSAGETETPTYESLVELELGGSCERLPQSASNQNDCCNMVVADGGFETLEEIKIRSKMEDILKECIAHHCDVLTVVRAFEEYWSVFFFMNVAVCMAQSVLLLTSSAMKDGNSNLMVHFGIVATFYSMLGIFCYLSQQLTVETELLQESIYGCGWTDSSKSFKKSIGIMVSVTNQPIIISAVGGIPLSLDTYNNVLNTAYSYYMVLQEL